MAKKVIQIKERSLDQCEETQQVQVGDIGIDAATGGIPVGAVVEIFGNEASGKTTIALEAADAFLSAFPDKNVYYFNYERAMDVFYVQTLLKGNTEKFKRFKIVEPDFLEDGMEYLLDLMDADLASLVIIDSLAAMQPKDEAEKALDKAQVGGFKAKLMAEVCRKIGSKHGAGSKTTICWINHVNPVLGGFSFIQQSETPGGKAVKFWASLRIEVSVISRLDREETIPGTSKKEKIPYCNVVKITVKKNKYLSPYKRAVAYVMLGKGLNRSLSLIDYGLSIGIIGCVSNQMYYLTGKEDAKVRGKAQFANKISSNKSLFDYLYKKINAYILQKRAEEKNINADTVSTGADYVLGGEDISENQEEDSISKEVRQQFSALADINSEGSDDGEDDPDAFSPANLDE